MMKMKIKTEQWIFVLDLYLKKLSNHIQLSMTSSNQFMMTWPITILIPKLPTGLPTLRSTQLRAKLKSIDSCDYKNKQKTPS